MEIWDRSARHRPVFGQIRLVIATTGKGRRVWKLAEGSRMIWIPETIGDVIMREWARGVNSAAAALLTDEAIRHHITQETPE